MYKGHNTYIKKQDNPDTLERPPDKIKNYKNLFVLSKFVVLYYGPLIS